MAAPGRRPLPSSRDAERERMSDLEKQILAALSELAEASHKMKGAGPRPNLIPRFEQIDALTRQLPSDTDPNLLHYLHKKSYEKARLFLEGRKSQIARGTCG